MNAFDKKISTDNGEYLLKRISKNEIDQLTDLFNRSRNRNLKYSFFRKKYDTAWTGIENVAIIITDETGDRIYGHLGVLPIPMQIEGKEVMSGQISDAVLDPILRGKNIFEIIIAELEELSKVVGVEFLWVSPSPQAVRGFEKRDWIKTNQLITTQISVKNVIPLNKICNKFRLNRLYQSYIKFVLSIVSVRTHQMQNPNLKLGKSGITISKEFVEHKNYTSNFLITKNDFTIWFKISDGIEIGCVSFFENHKLKSFIKTICSLARILGCHQISIMTFEDTFLKKLLSDVQWKGGNSIYFKSLGEFSEFERISLNYSDLNTF